MIGMLRALAAAALLTAVGCIAAWADAPGAIIAHHGRVYETRKAGVATPAFLEIDNTTNTADVLTGIVCPIADRSSIVDPNGRPIPQLTAAAGQHVTLSATGPHLLLQSTHFRIDQGGAIPCTLSFRNAGQILVYLYATPAP
jgi:copper(I)-binding protein